ncbi:uncharacterized protein ARMOST_02183 [Armillaria ostoyae]|uniref:Uncharacterized protein n=1 Tax=Armillaria ostoyae TaxID=47428 RepID=A0A284QR23_ARMOS|nr:uncharacterized protein ARMOST_02183 [Armillaria ostoyae]
MENQFSYETLQKNPNLILHKKQPDLPVGPLDGKRGAVLSPEWFILTPNATELYQPPLGRNREMFMRADFRYGDDDPLSWPQFYLRSHCWLACIRKRPISKSDPFYPLYDTPSRRDFSMLDSTSLVSGLGILSGPSFSRLQAACQKVINMSETREWGASSSLVRDNRIALSMLLNSIESLPFVFDRLCLTVAETQRMAIELRALIEYITIFRPRMQSDSNMSVETGAEPDLIGVFTSDAIVVQEFFKARVPVWMLKKLEQLPFTRIDSLDHPIDPRYHLNFDAPRLKLRSVFTGSATQVAKYHAIQAFTRSHLKLPDPFSLLPGEARENPPLLESSMSRRYQPYTTAPRQEKQHGNSGAASLTVPAHALLPVPVPVWRTAVETTSADKSRCHPEARIGEANGYIFPRPDIFVNTQSDIKMHTIMQAWLRLRPSLLARVSCTAYSAQPLPHQAWRTVLNIDWLTKKRHEHPSNLPTKSRKRQDQAVDFLAGCNGEMKISTDFNLSGPVFWNGEEYSTLSDNDRREVLWELAELNFRFEMVALDARAAQNGGNLHLLLCSIPYGKTMPFVSVDIGSANHGLGHPSWQQRAPYVFALMNAMRSWRDCPQLLMDKRNGYTEEEFLMLEREMAKFYVESFFCFFGHAPVIPRHLMHHPQTSFTPEVHEQMHTDRPGIVFDLAQYE